MSTHYVDKLIAGAKIPGGETYWPEQPTGTFCAWGETIEAEGSDCCNEILRHDVEIELYEPMDHPNPEAHRRLQKAFNEEELRWRKEPRILDLQLRLLMTTYAFSYMERVDYEE